MNDRKPTSEEVIRNAIKKGTLLDVDIKNRDDYAVTAQHSTLGSIPQASLDKNVAHFKEIVKDYKAKNKIMYAKRSNTSVQNALLSWDVNEKQRA